MHLVIGLRLLLLVIALVLSGYDVVDSKFRSRPAIAIFAVALALLLA